MNHMFLDNVTLFHMMDVATQFSVGTVVESTAMDHVTNHMEKL